MIKPFYQPLPVYTGIPQIYHHSPRIVQPMPQVVTTPKRLTLTPREDEVMELLGDAKLGYDEIAVMLGISISTLKKHREHIYFKLGVSNRFQAVEVWRKG